MASQDADKDELNQNQKDNKFSNCIIRTNVCISPPQPTVSATETTCGCKSNCTCCKLKNSTQIDYCKYVQPERTAPYRPKLTYAISNAKIGDKTTYRCSYQPALLEKAIQYKPAHTLAVGEGKVSGCTTHNMSFQEYKDFSRTLPIIPCKRNFLGSGPMQDTTTHKEDYVPKEIDVRPPYRPLINEAARDAPFNGKTTHLTSYLPIDVTTVKTESCRPCNKYRPPRVPVDCNTIHRLSFLPHKPQEPTELPWATQKPYESTGTMSDDTCYRKSYIPYSGDFRLKSYKPPACYKRGNAKMEDGTTYQKSYTPCELQKTESCRPNLKNLSFGQGKMSGDTVHKLSYTPYENALPAALIRPCRRKYTDDEPMQDTTTHKHDYVPKPISMVESYKPVQKQSTSNEPFSDKTTNNLSYIPHDLDKVKVKPACFAPAMQSLTGKMEGNTTHKLSYIPYPIQPPVDKPWTEHLKYIPSLFHMEGDTTNSLSYQMPGTFIKCPKNDPNCIPCPLSNQAANDKVPCCPGCCCQCQN